MSNWSIIVAIGENNEIGKDNDLLWRISADMKRFKAITTGNTIVMGRKTFDSLPKGALPNRRNIILSHQKLEFENTEIYNSIDKITEVTKNDENIFVIGGASLYEEFINTVDKIYLTKVHSSFNADVFFPKFNMTDWNIIEEENIPKGEKNEFSHTFYILKRKN